MNSNENYFKDPVILNSVSQEVQIKNKFNNNNSKSAAFRLLSCLSYDNYEYIQKLMEILLEYHK